MIDTPRWSLISSQLLEVLNCEDVKMSAMFKVLLLLASLGIMVLAETVKRDLIDQQGLEFLQLGNFGPVSRISSHPAFSHLRLTSLQAIGFINVLFSNGILNPNALRLPNGQPVFGNPYIYPGQVFGGQPFAPSIPPIDPYYLYVLLNHAKYLPFGLGPQGFYGSTGLPKPKPPGLFKYDDKN